MNNASQKILFLCTRIIQYTTPVLIGIILLRHIWLISTDNPYRKPNIYMRNHILQPIRGKIFDRHHNIIIDNCWKYRPKITPKYFLDHPQDLQNLSQWTSLLTQNIYNLIQNKVHKNTVSLPILLSSDQYQKRIQQNFSHVFFDKELVRTPVPYKELKSLIGKVGRDKKGLSGIEYTMDKVLRGHEGYQIFPVDSYNQAIYSNHIQNELFQPGSSIYLTISLPLQEKIHQIVDQTLHEYQYQSICIIVVHIQTGEIWGYYEKDNTPSQEASELPMMVAYTHEPGSTFKVFTFASALENHISPDQKIYCEMGSYRIPGRSRPLHDHHSYGELSVTKVLQKSSNIGTVKIAQKVGTKKLYNTITKFGFGRKTNILLNGESPGILRHVSQWKKGSIATIPMGHEIAVTPIQSMMGFTCIARGGILVKPHIIKGIKCHNQSYKPILTQEIRRVISNQTSQKLKEIMQHVVSRAGTARRAQIKDVPIAGKTGTAQKIDPKTHQYSHQKYYASFIGFGCDQKLPFCIGVFIDKPPSRFHYGGQLPAIIFRKISLELIQSISNNSESQNIL